MKLYLVTRRDLAPGAQASQLCHAMRAYAECHPALERKWFCESNTLALLTVADRRELLELVDRAIDRKVCYAPFHEPDLGGSLTAIALSHRAKALVRELPLAFA